MPKQKKMWDNILTVIMSVLCLLWIYPIVLILLNSLKTEGSFTTSTVFRLPTAETFAGLRNYVYGVTKMDFLSSMGYSLLITITSVVLILLSSVLSACVAAFAGPISFVGIAVPHLAKSLFGTAKPILMIPACFLGGAGFCLLCDLIARTVFAPTELSISTVTALFGAPVVIYIMVHRKSSRG